ncbi:hypothetical protein, partial [Kitasatospora sp. NPDC093102]|uniref:hypothetical protein n=1 Tax=Kitasatospora sp. NPDC093102 TaxID=3155069 RepID=UPI0034450DBE
MKTQPNEARGGLLASLGQLLAAGSQAFPELDRQKVMTLGRQKSAVPVRPDKSAVRLGGTSEVGGILHGERRLEEFAAVATAREFNPVRSDGESGAARTPEDFVQAAQQLEPVFREDLTVDHVEAYLDLLELTATGDLSELHAAPGDGPQPGPKQLIERQLLIRELDPDRAPSREALQAVGLLDTWLRDLGPRDEAGRPFASRITDAQARQWFGERGLRLDVLLRRVTTALVRPGDREGALSFLHKWVADADRLHMAVERLERDGAAPQTVARPEEPAGRWAHLYDDEPAGTPDGGAEPEVIALPRQTTASDTPSDSGSPFGPPEERGTFGESSRGRQAPVRVESGETGVSGEETVGGGKWSGKTSVLTIGRRRAEAEGLLGDTALAGVRDAYLSDRSTASTAQRLWREAVEEVAYRLHTEPEGVGAFVAGLSLDVPGELASGRGYASVEPGRRYSMLSDDRIGAESVLFSDAEGITVGHLTDTLERGFTAEERVWFLGEAEKLLGIGLAERAALGEAWESRVVQVAHLLAHGSPEAGELAARLRGGGSPVEGLFGGVKKKRGGQRRQTSVSEPQAQTEAGPAVPGVRTGGTAAASAAEPVAPAREEEPRVVQPVFYLRNHVMNGFLHDPDLGGAGRLGAGHMISGCHVRPKDTSPIKLDERTVTTALGNGVYQGTLYYRDGSGRLHLKLGNSFFPTGLSWEVIWESTCQALDRATFRPDGSWEGQDASGNWLAGKIDWSTGHARLMTMYALPREPGTVGMKNAWIRDLVRQRILDRNDPMAQAGRATAPEPVVVAPAPVREHRVELTALERFEQRLTPLNGRILAKAAGEYIDHALSADADVRAGRLTAEQHTEAVEKALAYAEHYSILKPRAEVLRAVHEMSALREKTPSLDEVKSVLLHLDEALGTPDLDRRMRRPVVETLQGLVDALQRMDGAMNEQQSRELLAHIGYLESSADLLAAGAGRSIKAEVFVNRLRTLATDGLTRLYAQDPAHRIDPKALQLDFSLVEARARGGASNPLADLYQQDIAFAVRNFENAQARQAGAPAPHNTLTLVRQRLQALDRTPELIFQGQVSPEEVRRRYADLSPLLKELRELSEAQVELPPLIAQTGKMTPRERESRARLYEAQLLIGQSVMGEVAAELAHRQKHEVLTGQRLEIDPERYRQLLRMVQESERELALQISLDAGTEKRIAEMFAGLEDMSKTPAIPGHRFPRLARNVALVQTKLSSAAVMIERKDGARVYLNEIDLAKKLLAVRAYPAEELLARLDVAETAALRDVDKQMVRKVRGNITWIDRIGRLTAKDLTDRLEDLQSEEVLRLHKETSAAVSARAIDLLTLDTRSHLIADAREVREFRAKLREDARQSLASPLDHWLETIDRTMQQVERDPESLFRKTVDGARTLVSTGLLTAAEAVQILQLKDPDGRFPKVLSRRKPLSTFATELLPDFLNLAEKGAYLTTHNDELKQLAQRLTDYCGEKPTVAHREVLSIGLRMFRDTLLTNGTVLAQSAELLPLVMKAVEGVPDRRSRIFQDTSTEKYKPGLTPDPDRAKDWEDVASQYRGAGLGMVLDGRITPSDLAEAGAEGSVAASLVDGGRAFADLVDVFTLDRPETGYSTDRLGVLAASALRAAAEDLTAPQSTDRTRRRLDFLESQLMEQGRDSGSLVEAAALLRDDLDWAGRTDPSGTDVLERLDRMSGAGLKLVSEGLMDIEQFDARLKHLAGFRNADAGLGPDFEARIERLRQRAVLASVEYGVDEGTNIHVLNAGDLLLKLISVAEGLTSAEAGPDRVAPEKLFELLTRLGGLAASPSDSYRAGYGVFGLADAALRYHTAEPGPTKEAAFAQWLIALEGVGLGLLGYDPGLASWAFDHFLDVGKELPPTHDLAERIRTVKDVARSTLGRRNGAKTHGSFFTREQGEQALRGKLGLNVSTKTPPRPAKPWVPDKLLSAQVNPVGNELVRAGALAGPGQTAVELGMLDRAEFRARAGSLLQELRAATTDRDLRAARKQAEQRLLEVARRLGFDEASLVESDGGPAGTTSTALPRSWRTVTGVELNDTKAKEIGRRFRRAEKAEKEARAELVKVREDTLMATLRPPTDALTRISDVVNGRVPPGADGRTVRTIGRQKAGAPDETVPLFDGTSEAPDPARGKRRLEEFAAEAKARELRPARGEGEPGTTRTPEDFVQAAQQLEPVFREDLTADHVEAYLDLLELTATGDLGELHGTLGDGPQSGPKWLVNRQLIEHQLLVRELGPGRAPSREALHAVGLLDTWLRDLGARDEEGRPLGLRITEADGRRWFADRGLRLDVLLRRVTTALARPGDHGDQALSKVRRGVEDADILHQRVERLERDVAAPPATAVRPQEPAGRWAHLYDDEPAGTSDTEAEPEVVTLPRQKTAPDVPSGPEPSPDTPKVFERTVRHRDDEGRQFAKAPVPVESGESGVGGKETAGGGRWSGKTSVRTIEARRAEAERLLGDTALPGVRDAYLSDEWAAPMVQHLWREAVEEVAYRLHTEPEGVGAFVAGLSLDVPGELASGRGYASVEPGRRYSMLSDDRIGAESVLFSDAEGITVGHLTDTLERGFTAEDRARYLGEAEKLLGIGLAEREALGEAWESQVVQVAHLLAHGSPEAGELAARLREGGSPVEGLFGGVKKKRGGQKRQTSVSEPSAQDDAGPAAGGTRAGGAPATSVPEPVAPAREEEPRVVQPVFYLRNHVMNGYLHDPDLGGRHSGTGHMISGCHVRPKDISPIKLDERTVTTALGNGVYQGTLYYRDGSGRLHLKFGNSFFPTGLRWEVVWESTCQALDRATFRPDGSWEGQDASGNWLAGKIDWSTGRARLMTMYALP